MATTLQSLVDVMELLAPTRYAESWDNVGLLVGDPSRTLKKTLLCIDYTPVVAREARDLHCDSVIAYHPPIFKPLANFVVGGVSELVFDAARDGIAIYSPHTALDVAPGGTNDALADLIELRGREPLKYSKPSEANYKIVTFVPRESVDTVADALFAAGAGRIGNYSKCSFRSSGKGTFQGDTGTHPAAGEPGKFETTDEVRLETIVTPARVHSTIEALRRSHPYEEAAIDVFESFTPPQICGQGRVGTVPEGATVEMLINRLKREIGIDGVLVAGDATRLVRRAAVFAGSGSDGLDASIEHRVDLYLTGELRHHDALKAVRAGVTVVCLLHSNSERPVLKWLMAQIKSALPGVACEISQVDSDPLSVM